jgi:DNA replication protein DnaC
MTRPDDATGKFCRVTGAPIRLARLKLGTITARESPLYREALERLAEVAAALYDGDLDVNLVLTGDFGVGKTRVAVHLLRFAYDAILPTTSEMWHFPRFFTARAVVELRFARSYSSPEDEEDAREADREALRRSPLVVIDDVGRIAGYKGEETYVEAIVEDRYENERATILTFNQMPTEGRFADFLRYFEEVSLVGASHRG